ncbi:hypothetical protein Q7P37_006537 [Cladosporium fusiforme]
MKTPEPDIIPNVDERPVVDAEDRLDELWETYLDLLEQYTKAQQKIQKSMSSGFFSLAKAQSSAPFGRRYGQDWFDERMKARQRTHVSTGPTDPDGDSIAAGLEGLKITIESEDLGETAKEGMTEESKAEAETEDPAQQPSPLSTPEPERPSKQTKQNEPKADSKPRNIDPLRWYGILVPPELKRAQTSFTGLLQSPDTTSNTNEILAGYSPITDAINAARGLREIEVDIRKTRKAAKKAEKAKSAALA